MYLNATHISTLYAPGTKDKNVPTALFNETLKTKSPLEWNGDKLQYSPPGISALKIKIEASYFETLK